MVAGIDKVATAGFRAGLNDFRRVSATSGFGDMVPLEEGSAGQAALHAEGARAAASAAAQEAVRAERRRAPRNHVIKSARLVFGDNVVFNCLVLDESTGGVMVDLGAMVKVPDQLTIQFAGGFSYLAERRWMVGTKAGLKFLGGEVITEQTAERMRLLAGILQSQGIAAAIQTLRAARFFDNTVLRESAEAAEAAHLRFEAVLTGRA